MSVINDSWTAEPMAVWAGLSLDGHPVIGRVIGWQKDDLRRGCAVILIHSEVGADGTGRPSPEGTPPLIVIDAAEPFGVARTMAEAITAAQAVAEAFWRRAEAEADTRAMAVVAAIEADAPIMIGPVGARDAAREVAPSTVALDVAPVATPVAEPAKKR